MSNIVKHLTNAKTPESANYVRGWNNAMKQIVYCDECCYCHHTDKRVPGQVTFCCGYFGFGFGGDITPHRFFCAKGEKR